MLIQVGGLRPLITWAAEDGNGGGGASDPPLAPAPVDPAPSGGPPPSAAESVESQEGEVVPPAVQAPSGTGQPPASPKPPKVDWREARIAKLTAQLAEARQQAAAPASSPVPTPAAEAEINSKAERLATQLEAQREFNRRCNETAVAGRAVFGEELFNNRVMELRRIVDGNDPSAVATYNTLLEAAMETGEGARVIHALGADPNEAARLMSLPPVKMALEVAKLAAAKAADVPLTGAPKPVTPIGGRGASNERIDPTDAERSDRLDTATWMKRREEQVKERARA